MTEQGRLGLLYKRETNYRNSHLINIILMLCPIPYLRNAGVLRWGYYTLKKVKYIMKQETDLFHQIALEQYIRAMMIGKHNDSEYVKQKTYEAYEWELKKK
tara:strand:- start:496 stop:798 length:303 start_codon:yes stop_codon:yes gene_type:complete